MPACQSCRISAEKNSFYLFLIGRVHILHRRQYNVVCLGFLRFNSGEDRELVRTESIISNVPGAEIEIHLGVPLVTYSNNNVLQYFISSLLKYWQ